MRRKVVHTKVKIRFQNNALHYKDLILSVLFFKFFSSFRAGARMVMWVYEVGVWLRQLMAEGRLRIGENTCRLPMLTLH